MYTQCPECQTAFRVTAKVLQQAAGRVRCGGCGNAFNALQSLSEDMPGTARGGPAREDEALLRTLNEMAGPDDVRIEDTGIEWRVVDNGEPGHGIGADAPPGPTQITEEMRFDDNTPLPDDFGEETEDVYRLPETPQRREADHLEPDYGEIDRLQVDLALGEPDEWQDLLDEVADVIDEDASPDAAPGEATGERSIPLEVEEELAAIHSELSSMPEQTAPASADAGAWSDRQTEAEVVPAGEHEAGALTLDELEDLVADEDDTSEDDLQAEPELTLAEPGDVIDEPIFEEEEIALEEFEQPAAYSTTAGDDRPVLESTDEFNEQIEAARRALAGEADATADPAAQVDEYEDLAMLDDTPLVDDGEDEERDEEQRAEEPQPASTPISMLDDPAALFDENSPEVETIVMEGDFVSAALEEKARENRERAHAIEQAAHLADTYARNRGMVRGGRRKTDPPGFGVIAAVFVLTLALLLQVVHASRRSLSTYGAFNQTIGPVYRILGNPVTPLWDVKGWQFQATSGATDENEQVLTIFSRIVNRSERPLPYPLVHVSLTDRWEEIIGSRVLEPNEYLAGDLDPSIPVAPNENFTAVITIESPSAEATGFKLNVCYRVAEGRVRCATEDFKD